MRTTTHILNHQRSGNMLELLLDEETGAFDLHFRSPPLRDADFLRGVERWCKQIGTGWARRNGNGKANAVRLNFSTTRKGKFTIQMKGNQNEQSA